MALLLSIEAGPQFSLQAESSVRLDFAALTWVVRLTDGEAVVGGEAGA
jgi:hypothetical protein